MQMIEKMNKILQRNVSALRIILVKAIYDDDHRRGRHSDGLDRLNDQVREPIPATFGKNGFVFKSLRHRISHRWEEMSELIWESRNELDHVIAGWIPPGKEVTETKLLSRSCRTLARSSFPGPAGP